ncbi:MAG: hypothetical protein IJF08_01730, partial [Clostridia bacterium]|nr:hypothetical protein [Clostridia bacterium]
LVDLRVANANLIRYTFGVRSYARRASAAANAKRTPFGCPFGCVKATKKIFFVGCNKDSNPSKINTFRPSGEKLH